MRQLRSAIALARNKGLRALFRAVHNRLGQDRDEARLCFKAMSSNRPTGVMIDVGAHHGSSLAPFAASGWQVYAFEPDSDNRAQLHSAFGTLNNVRIEPTALSDHVQEGQPFYTSRVSTGISSLSNFHASHVESGNVDVTTLAIYLQDNTIPAVDFLKIDTEGFDLFVLKGFPWDKVEPSVILCEFEDTKTVPLGYSFRDLAEFIQQKGYRVIVSEWYPIREYGTSHRWRRYAMYPCDLEDDRAWGNIIATKNDALSRSFRTLCRL